MDPIRYITALLLIGGLLALAIWMLRRFRLGNPDASRSSLKITAHASLGAREKLVVVRFGDKDHLIGVTPGSISHIATADRESSSTEEHRS
ncbi:MAG: flagellar biosynthetic protein FliO [Gammaproteobacteria bacterium]|nr:flagellar biosynthetic protein FliO [Gammaproteobacteria bacterium]